MASIFAAFTVEPLVFICFVVFFLDLVTLPQIILDNVCAFKHNQSKCHAMTIGSYKDDFDVVQKESSLWFGAYLVTSTFITIFTLPTIGTLSDVIGRIKIMYLTPVSLFCQKCDLFVHPLLKSTLSDLVSDFTSTNTCHRWRR